MSALPVVHGLWTGSELSSLELLTLRSFIQHGHVFYLWVYDMGLQVPDHVQKKDAREILPEEKIFYYKNASKYGHGKGSIAGFSDIFRYKLLYEYGGMWVDMDITCLEAFDSSDDYILRYHHQLGVVGNILKCPKNSPFLLWCYEQSIQQINADNRNWTLPIEILYAGVRQFGLQAYIQRLTNNDQWPLVAELLRKNKKIPAGWKAIHWMNEEFRHLGIDKNKAIEGSVYGQLLRAYDIPYTPYTSQETKEWRWKLSKLHYTFINLRARWDWWKGKTGAGGD